MFYAISQKRLLDEIQFNAKGKGKGVVNWFVNLENSIKVLNIIYDYVGIKYICKIPFNSTDDVSPAIKVILDARSEILGFYSFEEEKEDIPQIPDFDDVMTV